jgi:DNA-binding NarL/FixJ family response regulator
LEDEPANLRTLVGLIARRPELDLVYSAVDGEEALGLIRSAPPDLAFLDINVPLKSGLRVAEQAAELGCLVVFTTALTSHALGAYKLGAVDYLVKPVDAKAFDRAVDRALALLAARDPGARSGTAQATQADLLRTRYRLTPAELDLAAQILSGCPKELLEERSGKSARVIKSHLQSIYRKTVNEDPRAANAGRGDKFGRLVYFLFTLKERQGTGARQSDV